MAKEKPVKKDETVQGATEQSVSNHITSATIRKEKTSYGDFQVLDLAWDKVTLSKDGVASQPCSEGGAFEIHEDLRSAFRLLLPHFAILFGLKKASEFKKDYFENKIILGDDQFDEYQITGLHFKEKKSTKYVMLTARKTLPSGKVVNNIILPMEALVLTEDGYQFANYMNDAVNGVMVEIGLYTEGKYAPRVDLFAQPKEETKLKKVS